MSRQTPVSLILSAFAGFVLFLAIPPANLFFMGWIGLIPLFIALDRPSRAGFSEGFVAGFIFNLGTLYWLALNSGTYWYVASATMIAGVLYLSMGWGVAAWIFRRLYDRLGAIAWLSVPFSWAAWEGWMSNIPDISFAWSLIALTQVKFPPILQIMEFTGVWGVSFWVVSLNLVIFWILKNRERPLKLYLLVLAILAIIPIGANLASRRWEGDYPMARVMVVQGNIDPLDKWLNGAEFSWAVYDSLSRQAADNDVDLVLWPETAFPGDIASRAYYNRRAAKLAEDIGASIITGASGYAQLDSIPRAINTAYQVDPKSGVIDNYSKRNLVPFGERVPFQKLIPKLGDLNFGQAEFLPGLRQTIFSVKTDSVDIRVPALICFESVFPNQARNCVQRGANLLATISNDGWYGKSSEREQIAEISRFRCLETRRSMARASNTGISFCADHLGRTICQSGVDNAEALTADLPLVSENTFFVRYGNVFLMLTTFVYGTFLAIGGFKCWRYKRK